MEFLEAGHKPNTRKIAYSQNKLQKQSTHRGLFWLGGFKSDMNGSKANALVDFGLSQNLGVTRFDYSGHGQSGGAFLDGSISAWLEDALAVFKLCKTSQILVGSSMGAWLALLLNNHVQKHNIGDIVGIILIAPAVDMTKDLMLDKFTKQELLDLENLGRVSQPSDYGEPYILTKKLIEDGAKHLLFGSPINTNCPVHILQGGQDVAVPPSHALKLMAHLMQDPITLSMVPEGDHSLSRPEDLALLGHTIEQIIRHEG